MKIQIFWTWHGIGRYVGADISEKLASSIFRVVQEK
jgi:hypothetical protein